jgi:predicted RND superfamily exporter protein
MTEFIIKYRWYIIGLCAAIGAGFGLLIPGARTDPEIRNYVPSSMNSRLETDKIESEFGVQDMVVILFSDNCILTEKNLLQIKEIDRDISRLKGISGRISPFTIKTIKGENGMMVAERLIQKIPVDKQGVRNLENEITGNRFVRDIVVSSDMTTASITATIDNIGSEIETLQRIDSVNNRWAAIYKAAHYVRCEKRRALSRACCIADNSYHSEADSWGMAKCYDALLSSYYFYSYKYGDDPIVRMENVNHDSSGSDNSCCCCKQLWHISGC